MAVEHINENDTLNTGRVKINSAIDQSNGAIEKATNAETTASQAMTIANEAKTQAQSTQTQLDNIIIENGQSDAEVVQARTKADGTTFPLLKDRLNDVDNKIGILNKQLNEKVNQTDFENLMTYSTFKRYGRITLPPDFDSKGIVLTRGVLGRVYHNVNLDFDKETYDEILYFDTDAGNDSTGNGSSGSPYKTLAKCFNHIENSLNARFKIIGKGRLFRDECYREDGGLTYKPTLVNKTVYIVGANDDGSNVVISNAQSSTRKTGYNTSNPPLSWTSYNAIWKTTRNNVFNVVDLKNKDFYGIGIPLQLVSTLAECENTPNTWYTDGTTVYVHTYDSRKPDDDVLVCLRIAGFYVKLINSKLIMKNFDFYDGLNMGYDGTCYVEGDLNSTFIGINCKASGGNMTNTTTEINHTNTNGFAFRDVGTVMLFGCKTGYNRRDGFNYHYYNTPTQDRRKCFIFEYECIGHQSGYNDSRNTNQITTAHEGVTVLRVGCVGHDSGGAGLQDINDCYTVCVDCNMFASRITGTSGYSTGFRFEGTGTGKAILINCNGDSYWSITGTTNFPVTIKEGFPNYTKIKDVAISLG